MTIQGTGVAGSDLAQQPVTPQAAAVLDCLGVGAYVVGRGGLIEFWNARASALLGWTSEQLVGMPAHEVLHADSGLASHCPILEVRAGAAAAASENDLLRRSDGSLLPVWWNATPLHTTATAGAGEAAGCAMVVFGDITDRQAVAVSEAAEREQQEADLVRVRRSVSDLGWIAELIQVVSTTLDEREALTRLVRLMVPRLADIAIVDQIAPGGELTRVGGAVAPGLHLDLNRVLAMPEVAHRDGGRSPLISSTIAAGTVVQLDAAAMADADVLDLPSRRLLAELGPAELLLVPLVARSHAVGVLGLMRLPGSPAFTPVDRLLSADVGRRAGLALDNARLYRTQASNSEVLQRALLPELPVDPRMPCAARYLPARELFDVGGDWYDVFCCPVNPERRLLVIGDVAGHDLAAATTMSTLRNLLRGISITVNEGPAGVLDVVDANLEALGVRRTATCVVLVVEPAPDGSWTIEWSNAGHHPPVLIGQDRSVRMLSGHGPLLGAGVRNPRPQNAMSVPAGSTLLMYTDGLIENRREDFDVSYTRLRRALTALPAAAIADPDLLVDTLLTRLPGSGDDDTAVLAVHLPKH